MTALVHRVSPAEVVAKPLLAVVGLGDDAVVALWLRGVFLEGSVR